MAETQRRARITFKGQSFSVKVPDEGQLLALSFASEGAGAQMIGVIGQVVHACLGDERWNAFIKGLSTGEYTGPDFQELVTAILASVKDPSHKPPHGMDVADPTLSPRDRD